jgi:hypothetical protein
MVEVNYFVIMLKITQICSVHFTYKLMSHTNFLYKTELNLMFDFFGLVNDLDCEDGRYRFESRSRQMFV